MRKTTVSPGFMVSVRESPNQSARQASKGVGEVVYAYHCLDGAIKIGHAVDLVRRVRRYGPLNRVLAYIPGTRADEQAIHRRLKSSRAYAHEYYRHTPEVMAVLNDMRAECGLKPLKSTKAAA